MPDRIRNMRTPGKVDITHSIETVKGYMPNMPTMAVIPTSLPDIKTPMKASIKRMQSMKSPSPDSVKDNVKYITNLVSNFLQFICFMSYTGIVDGAKKYILTKDAIAVVLYSWIGVILRNSYFCQDVHNWTISHNLLNTVSKVPVSTHIDDITTISPISVLPRFNSNHFAIIVLVVFNKLNRYERGLMPVTNDKSIWVRSFR